MKKNQIFLLLAAVQLAACSTPATPAATETAGELPEPGVSTSEGQTAAPQSSAQAVEWKTYNNDTYHFSYEYPSAYDDAPYNCGPQDLANGNFKLGNLITFSVQDMPAATIETIADEFVKGVDLVQQRINQEMGGEPAVTVEYRSGGTNRFGTVTYLTHADQLWTFSWMGGGWCEVEGGGVFEGDAYSRLQSSLQFTD